MVDHSKNNLYMRDCGAPKKIKNNNYYKIRYYYAVLLVTVYWFGRGDILGPNDEIPVQYPSDMGLSLDELTAKYGYPFEHHTVQTEDGYILTIHRIPSNSRTKNETQEKRPVVLLQSGVWCDSSAWIIMGPGKSLAYLLADRGYDVWLENARGTTYSRKHVSLNPDEDAAFWKFSFNEMGIYDLPAVIDYILDKTGQKQINYIGHSQGPVAYFVMLSEKPEYNSKINLGVAFAPGTYLNNTKNPYMLMIANNLRKIQITLDLMGIYKILSKTNLTSAISKRFCHDESITQNICMEIFFAFAGPNPEQFNKTMIPVITTHIPAGGSTRQIYHFAQGYNSGGRFQKYDFGKSKNKKIYGTPEPPQYNISKVTAPTVLYSGSNDTGVDPVDVIQLSKDIINAVGVYNIETFNHMDFLWANDVATMLYEQVLAILKKYN